MEAVVFPDPLDRRNVFSVCLHGEREARYDAPAIDMNRASTALPVIAAFARSGQVEPFAQRVEERYTSFNDKLAHAPVDD
jgi:hypothetical protein